MEISIDLLWLDREGRVLHVERGAPPCPELPCPSYAPGMEAEAWYVLEIDEGQSLRYGLDPGSRILLKGVPEPENIRLGAALRREPPSAQARYTLHA